MPIDSHYRFVSSRRIFPILPDNDYDCVVRVGPKWDISVFFESLRAFGDYVIPLGCEIQSFLCGTALVAHNAIGLTLEGWAYAHETYPLPAFGSTLLVSPFSGALLRGRPAVCFRILSTVHLMSTLTRV